MASEESSLIVDYVRRNLVTIRKRLAGTQDRWAEETGISQSSISALERGQGWEQLAKLDAAIRHLGGDPLELVRGPMTQAGQGACAPIDAELLHLWSIADGEDRAIVMATLRRLPSVIGRVPRSAPGLE